MHTFLEVLKLGRDRLRGFILVAVLVSLGTGAGLLEPWIYRAIIDDIAGVFVAPPALAKAEKIAESVVVHDTHLRDSGARILKAPLQKHHDRARRRSLAARTPREAVTTVLLGAVLLLLTRLIAEALRIAGDNRASILGNEIERGFITRTFSHVLRLPLAYFSRRASGAVARQIDQSDQIAPVFNAFAQELWPDLFTLAAALAILLSVNWELAAIALVAVPVYGIVTWRMTRRLETGLDDYYELWDDVSSRIQQSVAGIKTIQSHGTVSHEERQLDGASRNAYSAYLSRNRLQNRYSYIQETVVALSKAGIVALGGVKALRHQLTPGDVVLFLQYLDLLYQPIQGLTELYTSLQQRVGAFRRAQRLLAAEEAPGEDHPPFRPEGGEIEFSDVRFAYDSKRPVLDGVSLKIARGEKVGLVGPSGAGKTTLTDLLSGLYVPQSGTIRIDGQSLDEVAPSSLRSAVRGVAADGMLFRASIRENIRYGRLEAGEQEILEAARLAGLEPLLTRLPDGLDTTVGERGVELSVGERQRVLLARAFVARPTILILDEATANLDFKTEQAVKEALEEISKGRTTIVIAHRRSMLTEVDRVLVLRGGRIEQDGPPALLAQVDGYFREMMRASDAA